MNRVFSDYQLVERRAGAMQGVFSVSDLRNLLAPASSVDLFRRIENLQKHGVLRRFCKSVYVADPFDMEMLSCRINPESYVSCGNVLSRHLLIGVIPAHTVTGVKVGRGRRYGNGMGTVIHLGIRPQLMVGIEFEAGVRRANAEKAYLDCLYFHQKGHRFSFDVRGDVDIGRLDRERISQYLKHYRNVKFIRFVENCLNADV